jgi:hypothetical protein
MRVMNQNGTIMESNDAFVISTWIAKGYKEVPEKKPEKKPVRRRKKQEA